LTRHSEFEIAGRRIGADHPPLVIPEVGINHGGDLTKAMACVDAAVSAGAEIVKFQCHITAEEMVPNDVVPGNATESIWDIIDGCTLSESEEREVQAYCRDQGVQYLSTPFSRAAADRLEAMNVPAYKIGSGECNNTPLLEHIAEFGKPMILSTGMNALNSVKRSVAAIQAKGAPVALLHCTSMYPTPYDKVRLGAIAEMREAFPDVPIGLSDHSLGNWTCFGAVALGASVLEKHFTADMSWPGPDIEISIDPAGLKDLNQGSLAIWQARDGHKTVLAEEQPTIDFAYATVVTTQPIKAGERFSRAHLWVKRPGTGGILAAELDSVLGKSSATDLGADQHVSREDIA
jgi:N-acetylneuraminate synthase